MNYEKKTFILKRFPKSGQILHVYAVIVTLLYSWEIISFTKDFTTNWRLYLDSTDILGIFAYTLAGSFLESLIILAVLLLIAFLLPKKFFAEKFVLYGTILSITLIGSLIYLYTQPLIYGVLERIDVWARVMVISTAVLVILGEIAPFIRKVLELFAERCEAFLYIYIPISILSILVLVIRNLN